MGTATDQDQDKEHQRKSSLQSDVGKQLPKKMKYLTSIAIFYGNITFGLAFNTYGPVITTMQNKYETDDATISRVFTILTGCYMLGALTGGVIYNYVNRQFAVILLITTMAAIMFLTPHCPTMTIFFVSAAIMGLACGCYDAAQFVWIMEMWQAACPPYVQSQHFFYALGINFSSLLMAPFLDKDDDDEDETTTTLSSFSFNTSHAVAKNKETDASKLFIPYTIAGVLVAINGVAQILLFIFMRYFPPPPEEQVIEELQLETNEEKKALGKIELSRFKIGSWSLAKFRMVLLTASFYGAYQGMEFCVFQFFSKFAQNSDLKLSESNAAYVLTGMTTAFAVGRAISIIVVFKISTQLIICGNIVLLIIGDTLLVGWANSSLPILWTASILFGFGFSSIYGSISAYIERYLNFTNFIGAFMIVFGSGVAAIYPLIVGNFIEDNPIVLTYVCFFSISVLILSFGTLSYLTHKNKTRY